MSKLKLKNKTLQLLLMKPIWNDTNKVCSIRSVVSIILAAASFILMFADLKNGSVKMAISSIMLVIGFTASAIAAGVFKKALLSAHIIAVIAAVVLSSYAISGGNQGFAILWVLLVPMFALNVLDMSVGLLLSTYFLIFIPVLFYSPLNYLIEGKYTDSFKMRFPILYIAVFAMAVFIAVQKEYFIRKANIYTYIDDLTEVCTRQYFFEKAEEILGQNPNTQYDIQISDIVDFKKINELYGTDEGDKILSWIAEFLTQNMDNNYLIGRYGGDQFIVLAPHEYMRKAAEAELYSKMISEMNKADIPNFVIKFGLYEDIPHDKSVVSSCDKAHIALNSIKDQYGKDRAVYNDLLDLKIDTRRKIESSMRDALAENQFKVYYQPKHDAATGELVGAEALIRWIHPELGFMPPSDFIPLFEQNGFIVETDYYVWKRTCANISRWADMGLKVVPVSVNASKLVFEQQDLITQLHKIIKGTGVDASLLHIEVTETMMSDDIDALSAKLDLLRSMGVKIELDDFGSGYTSMNILSSLPIDIVKLDMSFMKQFGDQKRTKVLNACTTLARELGYKTVQEGVENKEQADVLADMGVDYIQGYYYSRPLPEDEFEQYIRQHM